MYKPPENSNRVKSIKSKFENIESQNVSAEVRKNGAGGHSINSKPGDKLCLSRQLSDPAKRNIKRTPAFRLDNKNVDRGSFQRSAPNQRSCYFETKVKQFNSALRYNNCDNEDNNVLSSSTSRTEESRSNTLKEVPYNPSNTTNSRVKPTLFKSKSSHDFAYIRSKFDNNNKTVDDVENQRIKNHDNIISTKTKDVSLLYTEPIPKSLRVKNCDSHIYSNVNSSDVEETKPDENIYTANTLKLIDNNNGFKLRIKTGKVDLKDPDSALTDTLKLALRKPLPCGPAPKKPPRTFEHQVKEDAASLVKNSSFLHLPKGAQECAINDDAKKSTVSKRDPRYMLNKLEQALRSNKIKTIKRQVKTEVSTTSGEDSDDSLLFKSKSHRSLPSVPPLPTSPPPSSNLNCFQGITLCKSTAYERIAEPNSEFFVSCGEEPVYAEPFNFAQDSNGGVVARTGRTKKKENVRNSLYYMSTALLADEDPHYIMDSSRDISGRQGCEVTSAAEGKTLKQMSAENSSLSSFTSDLDSATSTPLEENNTFETSLKMMKVKQLINNFETTNKNHVSSSSLKEHQPDFGDSSSARVEDLKMSLQKTLENSFSCESSPHSPSQTEDPAAVSVDNLISKFQTYVKTMPKYRKPKLGKNDRLFHCCLVVAWDGKAPQIHFKFPSHVKLPERIEDLCFPEAYSGPLDKSDNAQCYSLVVTDHRGERTFGYCRRVKPEGATKCIPLTYCILSKHRAPRFYKQILRELECRHGIPDKLRDELISEFYYNKFPQPGQSVKINLTKINRDTKEVHYATDNWELVESLDLTSYVHVNTTNEYGTLSKTKNAKPHRSYENIHMGNSRSNAPVGRGDKDSLLLASPRLLVQKNGETELILTLHHDTRYEEADLKPLHSLPPNVLLKIFASLLLERKVVLISCVISKLSCCVDALQSILYPFSWPHTFIPILPQCLWDVVESPTPVICGVLSVAVVNQFKIEDGIVVDLDEGDILIEEGDENSIISGSMKQAWLEGMALAKTVPTDNYVHSVYVSDAYLKVFITALKHYKNHINHGIFEKENFIRCGKTRGVRRFLKWFTETSLFMSFVDSVINDPNSFSLFDRKIVMYGSQGSNLVIGKLLLWNK